MLSTEEKIAIVNYRRQKSHESLNEAKEVIKLGFWSLAGNRLYYAAFHMASALLLDKGIMFLAVAQGEACRAPIRPCEAGHGDERQTAQHVGGMRGDVRWVQ